MSARPGRCRETRTMRNRDAGRSTTLDWDDNEHHYQLHA